MKQSAAADGGNTSLSPLSHREGLADPPNWMNLLDKDPAKSKTMRRRYTDRDISEMFALRMAGYSGEVMYGQRPDDNRGVFITAIMSTPKKDADNADDYEQMEEEEEIIKTERFKPTELFSVPSEEQNHPFGLDHFLTEIEGRMQWKRLAADERRL